MEMFSMRRWAALGAAVLVLSGSAPALGHTDRWAPTAGIEDGDTQAERVPDRPNPEQHEDLEAVAPLDKASPIALKSPSGILMEARSGRVLFQKNAHERRNPASVTKIMTLIVAFDAIRDGKVKHEDQVTISDEAAKQIGTIIFADTGETFTLADLIKSVAVGSANDAAVAVGEHISGSVEAFVQEMNQKAKALGMHDTQFQNPTGLSAEGHFTSAHDIAVMSRYAAINYPELIKLTSIYGEDLQVPWRNNGPTFRLWNNNKLLTWYPGADGLKTGWTEAAGYCLAATATRDGVRMISVIMGADTWKVRNAEAAKLLDYGFSNYTSVELAPKGKALAEVRVARGKVPKVSVVPQDLFAVSVAKGDKGKVKTEVQLPKRLEAPVRAGQVVGEIIATMDGKEIARMKLVSAAEVQKANLWQMMLYQVKRVLTVE